MSDEQFHPSGNAGLLHRVAAQSRGAVISTWLVEARGAYLDACRLLALRPPDWAAVHGATPASVWLDNLSPAYAVLADRVEREIDRGDQPALFDGDFESRLTQRWSFFAVNLLREADATELRRLVLQATVGLAGGIDCVAASRALADALSDRTLPVELWRDPPWI